MKLERRDSGSPTPEDPKGTGGGKKPVLVYILVLFVAAFLLMALSLLMHQRSNTEALGALSDSVIAMQGVQGSQEKIIALQEQLSETQEALIQAQRVGNASAQEAEAAQSATEKLQRQLDALTALYTLQQRWSNQDYDGCRETIRSMEDLEQVALLETTAPEAGVTPPAERYRQLKAAVEALEETP